MRRGAVEREHGRVQQTRAGRVARAVAPESCGGQGGRGRCGCRTAHRVQSCPGGLRMRRLREGPGRVLWSRRARNGQGQMRQHTWRSADDKCARRRLFEKVDRFLLGPILAEPGLARYVQALRLLRAGHELGRLGIQGEGMKGRPVSFWGATLGEKGAAVHSLAATRGRPGRSAWRAPFSSAPWQTGGPP